MPLGARQQKSITLRPRGTAESAPEDDQRKAEPVGERRQIGGVAKRVRAVEHVRHRATVRAHAADSGQQIPHERFTRGEELISEHEPRTRLDRATGEHRSQLRAAIRADRQVVLEQHRLSVEQERRARRRRVEQLIDQGDELLAEAGERQVPLAVPMRVRDDVNVEGTRVAHAQVVDRNEKGRPIRPPQVAR